MIAPFEPTASAHSQDFARLVELQQQHSETTHALEALENKMSLAALDAASENAEAYVINQEKLASLDDEIKALFEAHPEWREAGKKSVKTPFGSVEQRSATELVIPNPEATVILIEARAAKDKEINAANFIRVEKTPNVEALEAWSDDELSKVGITRKTSEKITVKAAKVKAAAVVKAAKRKD